MFGLLTSTLKIRPAIKNASMMLYATNTEYYNILIKYLKLDSALAEIIVRKKHSHLYPHKAEELIQNCLTLMEHEIDFTKLEYLTSCLCLNTFTLENRIRLFKEMGVRNIKILYLARYNSFLNLDKEQDLPTESNIALNLIKNMDSNLHDPPCSSVIDGYEIASNQYEVAMFYFKEYILPEIYLDILNSTERKRQKYRSFGLLLQTFNFLHQTLKFSPKFIQKHKYLLNVSIQNARSILTGLQGIEIDGKKIEEVLVIWPRILFCNVQNVKKLLTLFKEHNIPEGAISKCYYIFTLEPGVYMERLSRIENTPELSHWRNHIRVLYLVVHIKFICNRIETLLTANRGAYIKNEMIMSFGKFFPSLVCDKSVLYNKVCLRHLVNTEFGDSKATVIEDLIVKHPFWRSVQINDMQEVARYLKGKYSVDDIVHNVHIILYPLERIKQVLQFLEEEFIPQNGHTFTTKQTLALCLYMLEKPVHFSYNGVWRKDLTLDQQCADLDIETLKDIVDKKCTTKVHPV